MILLTGASGFIGKHLLSALIKEYDAKNIVALTSEPISECPYLLHYDYTFDNDYFVISGFDSINTIIHAGAFTPKKNDQANEWQSCNSNIVSTGKLLAASFPELEKFIYISTLDVYGKDDIITEQSPIDPFSLYGHSKLYCEKMVMAWANANHKIYQILRVGHVYGPGEEAYQKIIPVTIKKLLCGESLQVLGTGNEIRSFIYIKDIVACILRALKLSRSAGPVNLASSLQITIKNLVDKLVSISKRNAIIETVAVDNPGRNLIFDNSKMKHLLLQSETNLNEGLLEEWEYMQRKL